MPKILVILILLTALSSSPVEAAGNAEAGKVKAYTCMGCHGIPGYKNVYPTYNVPKLGGQNQDYVVSALKGYRSGERTHKTMNDQASSLSDQDIEDIAAWVSAANKSGSGDQE